MQMLKRFQKYCFLLSSLLFITGCSSDLELPTGFDGEVEFEITAKIGDEPITLAAGKNNRFMFTNTTVDSNGVKLFQGTFGEVGCQFCKNSLDFEFAQVSGNNNYDALLSQQSLISYRNSVIPIEILGYNTVFEINTQGTPPFTFDWDFGDNSTAVSSSSTNLQHQYTEAGIYNVCVNITDATGCQSAICREISTDNSMNCSIGFSVFNLGSGFANSFFFHTYSAGVPPFNYQWNVPNLGLNPNITQASPTITINQLGTMNISVNMTDDNNCHCSLAQTIDFLSPDSLCLNYFDYHAQPITTAGIPQDYFSTLKIQYVNDNGVIYSSALGEQPNFANINIISTEEYLPNSEGQPTKKVMLEFACRLFDENGNYIDLKEGKGTIAVAY